MPTYIPTSGEFIAEYTKQQQRKRDYHDAAIRKAAREQVLDALEAYRKSAEIKASEKGDYLYPGRAEKRDMLHTFGVWIESLRTQPEERK